MKDVYGLLGASTSFKNSASDMSRTISMAAPGSGAITSFAHRWP
jgi:hypothetical protein